MTLTMTRAVLALVLATAAMACGCRALPSTDAIHRARRGPIPLRGALLLESPKGELQRGQHDCGDAALAVVFRHFGLAVDYTTLSRELATPAAGATMLTLRETARRHGLHSEGWRIAPADLGSVPLPAIALLRRRHFVVLEAWTTSGDLIVFDPARGRLRVPSQSLLEVWTGEALLFGSREGSGPWLRPLNPSRRKQ